MVNKTKILSDLSKIAVDAMSTFSGIKKEVDTIVRLRIDKVINKMKLVKRDEFDILKKMVQKLTIEKEKRRKTSKKSSVNKSVCIAIENASNVYSPGEVNFIAPVNDSVSLYTKSHPSSKLGGPPVEKITDLLSFCENSKPIEMIM